MTVAGKKSINKNQVLTGVLYIVVGAVIASALIFYFLSTNPFLFEKYTGYKNALPENTIVDVGQANKDWAMRKFSLIVPDSMVSPSYKAAFDLSLNEIELLDMTNRTSIFPLMAKVKDAFYKNDYDTTNSLIRQMRDANDIEKKRETVVANYLDSLSTANSATVNNDLKKLTADFISTAVEFNKAFVAYSGLVDGMVSGRVGDNIASQAHDIMQKLGVSKIFYVDANKKLIDFFVNEIKKEKGISSSTVPVKK